MPSPRLIRSRRAHCCCACRSCLLSVSADTNGATPNGYQNGNGNGNGPGHSIGNGNGNGQISSSVLNPHLLALLNQVATGAVRPDSAALQLRELSSGYQQVRTSSTCPGCAMLPKCLQSPAAGFLRPARQRVWSAQSSCFWAELGHALTPPQRSTGPKAPCPPTGGRICHGGHLEARAHRGARRGVGHQQGPRGRGSHHAAHVRSGPAGARHPHRAPGGGGHLADHPHSTARSLACEAEGLACKYGCTAMGTVMAMTAVPRPWHVHSSPDEAGCEVRGDETASGPDLLIDQQPARPFDLSREPVPWQRAAC